MTYRCGHPKTPDNSWSYGTIKGVRRTRCKSCHRRRKNQTYQRTAEDRVRFRRPAKATPVTTAAIELYRAEKAKRPVKVTPAVPHVPAPRRIPRYWSRVA